MELLQDLSPHARVLTAVAPFVLAALLRIILGKNRVTAVFLSVSTVWFAINVLLAPYSARMQQEILHLRAVFR